VAMISLSRFGNKLRIAGEVQKHPSLAEESGH
jgi:hypothetical protein